MVEQLVLEREGYSERIRRMFGRKMVIALTGQRRVGKSFTMKAVIEEKRFDGKANIIYIDKEAGGHRFHVCLWSFGMEIVPGEEFDY